LKLVAQAIARRLGMSSINLTDAVRIAISEQLRRESTRPKSLKDNEADVGEGDA